MSRKPLLVISVLINAFLIVGIFALGLYLRIIPPFSSTNDTLDYIKELKPEDYEVTKVAEGLEIPWAIAFPDENEGEIMVTERTGKIRLIQDGVLIEENILDLTDEIVSIGEAGLMSLALDPNFLKNNYVYIYHTYGNQDNIKLKVSRYEYKDRKLINEYIVIDNIPAGNVHSGGEIAFGPDGKLYITTGDIAQADIAQDLSSLAGKTLRINSDGSIPNDNPFADEQDKRPEIWSYGHRNAQGLDWHPVTLEMFQSEHGPSGFDGGFGMDEINLVLRGQNYGWPIIRGTEMIIGMYTPLKVFTPAIAPASITFYENTDSGFNNMLFVAALRGTSILIFDVHSDKLREVGIINGEAYGRIREIKQGPNNSIYFTTSNRDGRGEVREGDDAIYKIELSR